MDLQHLKERFLTFAENESKGNSALYYGLSIETANDDEMLRMASYAGKGQPIPNIFFAAVHYLLLKNPHNVLALYYPTIQRKSVNTIPFNIFKKFCLENVIEIKELIAKRIVQTNVINRCSYLLPIFSKIIAEENRPVTIIDIGASAGLTLNFDKYEYWYNEQKVYGKSKVIVKSNIIDSAMPRINRILQPITKIGIDQNTIDPTDEDEILWLKALVWPDHLERFTAIDAALKLEEWEKIKFVKAATVVGFESEIVKADTNQTLIIYSTHVLYQFSEKLKNEFYSMLDRVSQSRDFYFLTAEGMKYLSEKYHSKETVIELTSYRNKKKVATYIAETNGHGNWIKWK